MGINVGKARRGRKKRTSKLKTLAKSKTTTVATLARSIRTLQKQFKRDQEYLNYAYTWNGVTVSSNYTVFPLSNFSSWTRIFGTTANDDVRNSVIWKSSGIDVKIDVGNEMANVNFTVMLLNLRDEAKGLIDSSGTLSLTNGDAYYTQSGLTMVNKKYFKILGVRRFSLGNHGQATSSSTAQTLHGTDRRYYFKLRPNKKLINPSGDWINMNQCQDPSGNYFIVCFNDNSILDLESPNVWMTHVATIQTL